MIELKKHERKIFDQVNCFADVQAFLVHRLSGEFNTGWISSDPHGMFDVVNKCWSKEILGHLEIDESKLHTGVNKIATPKIVNIEVAPADPKSMSVSFLRSL